MSKYWSDNVIDVFMYLIHKKSLAFFIFLSYISYSLHYFLLILSNAFPFNECIPFFKLVSY